MRGTSQSSGWEGGKSKIRSFVTTRREEDEGVENFGDRTTEPEDSYRKVRKTSGHDDGTKSGG